MDHAIIHIRHITCMLADRTSEEKAWKYKQVLSTRYSYEFTYELLFFCHVTL